MGARVRTGRKILLTTEDIVNVNNSYYFVAKELNAICRMDIENDYLEVIGAIPEEDLYEKRLCARIFCVDDELIFLPMNGRKIWICRLGASEWRSIEIENSSSVYMKMMQMIRYKDKLYFIGCFYPAIIVLDIATGKTNYIRKPFDEMKDLQDRENYNYFRCDYALKNGELYLASCLKNCVLKFNLENYEWKYIQVGSPGNKYSGIAWNGHHFWLAPRTGNYLVCWDGLDSFQEYQIENEEYEGFFRFTGVVHKGESIIFPAKDGKFSYKITKDDISTMEKIDERFLFYKGTEDGKIVSGTHDGVIIIESPSGKKTRFNCVVNSEEIKEKLGIDKLAYKKYFMKKDFLVEEDTVVALEELCLLGEDMNHQRGENIGRTGRLIWSEVVKNK